MKFFGTRPTYQLFSGAMFVTGCFYYLFNQFYIRKRTKLDDSDICKKKPSLDVEGREANQEVANKETEKSNSPLDVASKNEIIKNCDNETSNHVEKSTDPKLLLVPEATDGSSDSGVDNPTFNENECDNSVNDVKKDEKK